MRKIIEILKDLSRQFNRTYSKKMPLYIFPARESDSVSDASGMGLCMRHLCARTSVSVCSFCTFKWVCACLPFVWKDPYETVLPCCQSATQFESVVNMHIGMLVRSHMGPHFYRHPNKYKSNYEYIANRCSNMDVETI